MDAGIGRHKSVRCLTIEGLRSESPCIFSNFDFNLDAQVPNKLVVEAVTRSSGFDGIRRCDLMEGECH